MPDLDRVFINVVCWGTGYQMAQWITNKQSLTVRDAFVEWCVKHYGWPALVVTDQGTEFTGQAFVEYV